MKKITFKKALAVKSFVFILAVFSLIVFANSYSYLELFAQALNIIKTQYFKPQAPEKLISAAVKGMLLSLDSHSQLLSSEDVEELKKASAGEYYGLGLEVEKKDSFLVVLSVLKDSPAHKAGFMPGDKILKLNETSTKSMTILDFKKLFKKQKAFKLFFLRGNTAMAKTLQAQYLKIQSISLKEIEKGIFYLRIYIFSDKIVFEVNKAFKQKKIKALILDLRNNPGGLFDQSVKTADLFLKEGLIASYKVRTEKKKKIFKAHQSPYLGEFPLVVLINEFSASSSEVLTAALKDNKRAIVMGRKSFGKALLQDVFPLKKGYSLKLSVGEYKTPLGNSINGKGIKPDVLIPKTSSDFKEYKNLKEDPEISKAVNLLKTLI